MSRRLLIFDFDGTLADSFAVFLRCYNRIAARRGYRPIEPGQIDALRTLDPHAMLRTLDVALLHLPALMIAMRREMARESDPAPLFDGTAALLAALRRHGIRTAVVSSNSRHNVERTLGSKYASMIDHYACGASLFGKPRKLREVLRAAAMPPAAAAYVGDEVRDARAAAEVGLDFVAVSWGFARAEELAALSRLPPLPSFAPLLSWALAPSAS
jgi:phosphoglycolate phosphatase